MPGNLVEATPSAYIYPLLIKRLLEAGIAYAPEREIVYRDVRRQDYRALGRRVGQLANGLAALGIEPGDVVAVMDWDSHRYLEAFFAIPMMGAVLLTVNVRLTPEQIAFTINHARAKLLLINGEFLTTLSAIKDRLETVRDCVLISDTGPLEGPVRFAAEYEQLLASNSPDHVFPDFDENTRATTYFTTGTTGEPKGVYFSHRQIVLHALSLTAALALQTRQGRLDRDDVYMSITPMFHSHAWGLPYVATMAGLKQVYPGRYSPDFLLSLKQKEGVTISHCVPTILQMLLAAPSAAHADFSGWKIIVGGAAFPTSLARAALARGIDVFGGYGMSESGPVLAISHLKPHMEYEDEAVVRTKAGYPIPLVELRIVDGHLRDAARNGEESGEIIARAPWLTEGYLENRDASESLWSGGYLHTGDIGKVDSAGYFQITDRIKDVIKSGGEWISSVELEDLLLQHPSVAEAAVIGIPDPKWGERPLALIVPKPQYAGTISAEEIRAYLETYAKRGTISKMAVPERILFVERLEKTSIGKANKKLMREKYAA
jgi:acyl-CoA synthetase (AMP-forming)/AMP-acid ligase II